MKIAIIGPGALGCLMAALLADAGNEVWILDHDDIRVSGLSGRGLVLERDGRRRLIPVKASARPAEIGPVEASMLCVKSHDVSSALKRSAPLLTSDTLLIAFQNGILHLNVLKNEFGHANWAIGVTSLGSTLIGPGHVRHGGSGITRIGFLQSVDNSLLNPSATALTEAGIETRVVDNILEHVWGKLLINVGINALTAILDCPNGALLESGSATRRMTEAVREASVVGEAKGIRVTGDPVAMAIEVCKSTAGNISSMLQDVRKKRLTEIDAINGAVVAEAARLGIPAPINRELVREIKEIEKRYRTP